MALSDSRRNAILQTVLVRIDEGECGAPASFSEEEKECYLALEKNNLDDIAKGIDGNYSISCSCDW